MNLKKSELAQTQDLMYIGVRFQMDLGSLYLPELRIQALIAGVGSFSRVGAYKPAHQFLSLLGLMAATLQSVKYAHLHMHPIQWYLKQCWTTATHGLRHPVFVKRNFVHALSWWLDRQHLSQGMPFTPPSTTITVTIDASIKSGAAIVLCLGQVRHCTVASGEVKNASSTSMC